jgi:hypothetical protein
MRGESGLHRVTFLLTVLLTPVFAPSAVSAQSPLPTPAPSTPSASPDAASVLGVGTTEWMATVGTAYGVVVFHSARGHQYLMQTLSWGRVLSGPKFSGPLRGRFEWAIEMMPVYGQYLPNRVYGFGVSPLSWRWNFEPRGRYAPFAQLSGGLMKSTGAVPPGTTSANFTAHVGGGLRVLVAKQQSLVLAYRFDHISNGNRLDRNPGVNAHALHLGWSVLRPKK